MQSVRDGSRVEENDRMNKFSNEARRKFSISIPHGGILAAKNGHDLSRFARWKSLEPENERNEKLRGVGWQSKGGGGREEKRRQRRFLNTINRSARSLNSVAKRCGAKNYRSQ